jgi:hypothetical protein
MVTKERGSGYEEVFSLALLQNFRCSCSGILVFTVFRAFIVPVFFFFRPKEIAGHVYPCLLSEHSARSGLPAKLE